MANTPTPTMLAEFKRRYQEANEVSYNHDEFLTLIFMAAVDIERSRPATPPEDEW